MASWKLLLLVGFVRSQTTTEDYTVTYNPGEECLPYDGSVVPDCSKFVDPITKWPYYHEHSTNCSRFWECGPSGETCLVECANCQHAIGDNSMCEGRWALVFDVSYQYPDGPVCDWPSNGNCSNVVCDEMDPKPECCHNEDCQTECADAYCSTSFNCVYPDSCNKECAVNSECDHYDQVCDIPAPHSPEKCQWCDADEGKCHPGCSSDALNCEYPAPICDLTDHTCKCKVDSDCKDGDKCEAGLCVVDVCEDHPDCDGYDEVCNVAHDNCFYCGADDCPSNTDGCCEGCHMDSNCAHPAPICDMTDHRCKCLEDTDCHTTEKCEDGLCVPNFCEVDSDCDGFDAICNENHDNCFWCGGQECPTRDFVDSLPGGCCPGCAEDANCAYPKPVCSSHLCGCENNADCNPEDYCNSETNQCEPACVTDLDCNPEPEGECDVSTNIYTNCHYCDTSASPNECKPGCKNDHSETDPIVPYCPASSPDCNADTHECSAASGSVLLKRIIVKTASCESCDPSDEGITLHLTGLQDYITCNTNKLNHADKTDFSPSENGEFFADENGDDKVEDGWGACYESALKGEVNAATVSWRGSGSWTVGDICFDWSDPDVNVWVCSGDGSSLSGDDELALACTELDARTCP